LITYTLSIAQLSSSCATCKNHDVQASKDLYVIDGDSSPSYEHQLEWMLLSKATAQTYGAVLNTILNQTLQLSEHAAYWDEILGSPRWAGVYSAQTAPLRLWTWTKAILSDVRLKKRGGLEQGWRRFYGLVQEVVRERSVVELQARVLSPLAKVRAEAKRKQKELKRLREVNSNALAFLLGEGLSSMEDGAYDAGSGPVATTRQRNNVTNSIVLMEAVLSQVEEPSIDVETFEKRISSAKAKDDWTNSVDGGYSSADLQPSEVSSRLQALVNSRLPKYSSSFKAHLGRSGQPSRLIRYWLPATALILSSSTILRILVNRREDVLTWIRELGETARDFWINWVVEPTRKVIGTIRHDEGSEVAIMSKHSLEVDRDSLERMVVEFVRDNPAASGTAMSEEQMHQVRAKIREGDLTPVLKAYEKEMQSPLRGALRGSLIRTLLIQVQKTKVDVEVAMGGIDSLLKSQELVFG
jgi:nuclear-control-of-ATPase protein 2